MTNDEWAVHQSSCLVAVDAYLKGVVWLSTEVTSCQLPTTKVRRLVPGATQPVLRIRDVWATDEAPSSRTRSDFRANPVSTPLDFLPRQSVLPGTAKTQFLMYIVTVIYRRTGFVPSYTNNCTTDRVFRRLDCGKAPWAKAAKAGRSSHR